MAPEPRIASHVTGPATLILTHGHARADGMASAPIGAGYAVIIPGFDDAVTVLPGSDVRRVLRHALEDAILVAENLGNETRLRAYHAILCALEGDLGDPLLDSDHTVTFSCNPDGRAARLTHVGSPQDHQ